MNQALIDLVKTEVDVLEKLDHKNIIRLHKLMEEEQEKKPDGTLRDVFCLVLEFAKNGEIFNFIANGGAFPEKITRYYFHQLIEALEYLHE